MRASNSRIDPGFIRAGRRAAAPADHAARDSGRRPLVLAWSLGFLVIATSAAGIALSIAGFTVWQGDLDFALLAALVLLAVAAERTDLSMYGDSRVSLAFVPIFAAVLYCGMGGLAIVVAPAVLASAWGRPPHKTLFNFGTLMISGAASQSVLEAAPNWDYSSDWPQVVLPAALAGVANYLTNSTLVATAISLSGRVRLTTVWAENFFWLLPHYLILGLIALAIVAAYHTMGIWGVCVFVAPPFMMRLTIKQYLDRTTKGVLQLRRAHGDLQTAHEQLTVAMTSLGNAYDGTLRSLVAALDARDSETAGHSERVADITMAIAAELGVRPDSDEWRYISWGALLHDVGKIAIPDQILRKPSSLTDEEWESMRTHPHAGYEILRSVDFLAPAADMVLAHHERYDGTGYPRRLAGDAIPLGARLFMIADAFDAMTSDRVYRAARPAEEALAEILRCSGSQFDPGAVRAFLSVYQKRFVGTYHHRSFGGSPVAAGKLELSDSLRQAIAEAAGLDKLD